MLTPSYHAQVHFQGVSPQVFADMPTLMLDLIAPRLSQLLEAQMLFPVGELLSELLTLTNGHCHAHSVEEREEEYVEILRAALSS